MAHVEVDEERIRRDLAEQGWSVIGNVPPEAIRLDPENLNLGTERGDYMLDESLEQYGAVRSGAIDRDFIAMAGNKTVQKAVEKGMKILVIEVDGNTLPLIRRSDLSLMEDADGRAHGYALADNRAGQVNLRWDEQEIVRRWDANNTEIARFFKEHEIQGFRERLASPDLDEMAKTSKVDTSSFWPILSYRVPHETKERFEQAMATLEGEDWRKIDLILEQAGH